MDIRVNSGENLSLAIKKELINEGAEKSAFSGSVWNQILNLVDQQNVESKAKGEKGVYQGGNTRVPANWKKNYKVLAGQVLKFSEKIWNQIRSVVGLTPKAATETGKQATQEVLEQKGPEIPTPTQPNFIQMLQKPNFGLDKIEPFEVSSGSQSIVDDKTTKTNNTQEQKTPQIIKKDELQVVKRNDEQPVVQQGKEVKQKPKKGKTSSKPVVTKEADGSTTTTETKSDGTTVATNVRVLSQSKRGDRRTTLTTTTTTSPDGKITETVQTTARETMNDDGFNSIKPSKIINRRTTENTDGTTTVLANSEFPNSKELPYSFSYTIDKEGNILSNLPNGSKVSISTSNLRDTYDSKSTEVTITDKNGKEIKIPVTISNGSIEDVQKITDNNTSAGNEESLKLILGSLSNAISGLNSQTLEDLNIETRVLTIMDNDERTGEAEAGSYSKDVITLNPNYTNGLTSKTLAHEIGHAVDDDAQSKYQTNKNKEAFDKLFDLLREKDDGQWGNCEKYYATRNNKEFFAEYYAAKNNNPSEGARELLSMLENTQDAELKEAYSKVKNICDDIMSNTRAKSPEDRVNAESIGKPLSSTDSEFIKNNREKIIKIFGEEKGSQVHTEADLQTLFYETKSQLQKSNKYGDAYQLMMSLPD